MEASLSKEPETPLWSTETISSKMEPVQRKSCLIKDSASTDECNLYRWKIRLKLNLLTWIILFTFPNGWFGSIICNWYIWESELCQARNNWNLSNESLAHFCNLDKMPNMYSAMDTIMSFYPKTKTVEPVTTFKQMLTPFTSILASKTRSCFVFK